VPNVGISRKGFWQIIAICFAVFLFSAGMRLIEYPRWDQSSFKVDGEWLLATHDAYFWVAGAEDVNPIAEPMPMAIMLDVLSRIFPIPIANLAFWASILLAALVAIPLALWGYFLGAPYAALIVPILGALAPAFYNRTRLGFYDTDWATLFFPLLISWLLAVWIQARLRGSESIGSSDPGDKKERIIPAILIVLTAIALPWHNSIGLYIIALLGLAATLVVVLGVHETRSASFLTLLAIALVVGAGWIGAAVGLLLVWWMGRFPTRFRHPWSTRLIGVGLFVMLAVILGIQFQEYLSIAIPAYVGNLFSDGGSQASGSVLVFPSLAASVRETQKVNLGFTLEGIAFHPLLGAAGVLGYLVILWKKPAAVLLLPLLLLGLGAVRLGIRFTMFATPVVLLGLLVPLDWISARAGERYAWDKRLRAAVSLMIVLVLFPLMVQFNWRIPVETVVGKAHARALKTLGEIADPAGTIWTWWDYGYAAQHFAGLETFADGRRSTGDYLYSLGTVLGADTLDRSAEFIHFVVQQNFEPGDVWDTWSEAELDAWLDGLGRGETHSEPLSASQYLIVQWEGIPALPWIQFFGSWDFKTHEGQRSRVSKVMRPLELDLETGIFRFDGDQILHAVTVDILDESEGQHYDYPANAGGPHLLLNNATGEVMLLDETAYRSTFIQLLILPADQLEDASPFTLLIDDQPFVRVFELR
jgi:hypothetical protein